MKKQKVVTVISKLERASEVPIIAQLTEEGWAVKQISTSSFKQSELKSAQYTEKPALAITLLMEKED